jgi:hypothetical protein
MDLTEIRGERGQLKVSHIGPLTIEQLKLKLAECSGQHGWIMLTHQIRLWSGGWNSCFDGEGGWPLAGELALSSTTSLHLQHQSDGWHVHLYEKEQGAEDIYFTEEVLALDPPNEKLPGDRLVYEIWWRKEPTRWDPQTFVYQPFVARFCGFAGSERRHG